MDSDEFDFVVHDEHELFADDSNGEQILFDEEGELWDDLASAGFEYDYYDDDF